ncbi:hypothetical protein QBC46DRAFT_461926 [Diplogelasinospora grovesii]|uniref:Uncharacterized protein n=1 Tax=Diplogelasinospora grovesii TaxID=303347 RepID=A0AAN6S095_9PEZI|nr:hypothetical protein QBC46DRAFT_461926 [Diplogelasinospora grovesii]
MPTTEEFEAAYAAITATRGRSWIDAIDEHFPDNEDFTAFRNWVHDKYEMSRPPILEGDEFIAQVDSANLLQDSFLDRVVPSMTRDPCPTVPIGSDHDFLYRLVADPDGLVPHDQNCSEMTAELEPLIPYYILGLNTTVQPREPAVPTSRRKANMSEKATTTGKPPGFIFFQLGELQYARHKLGESWSPALAETLATTIQGDDLDWKATGFHLVARLGDFGGINGVYAIYNMFPEDEITGARQQVTHRFWGITPSRGNDGKPHEQFSVARIGDILGCLGYAKLICWHDKIEQPVELVRVKRAGNALCAIRQMVDESYMMR